MQYRLRFLIALAALVVVMVISALAYRLGMEHLEGEPRTFWSALEFAAETITTTGYGRDADWGHPAMVLFVIVLQIVGVMLVYMVVPLFLIPALEERFEARLPRRVKNLRNHVVVVRDGTAIRTTLELLARADVPTVILETNPERARELFDRKQPVVYAPQVSRGLEHVALDDARALIANGTDEANVGVILAARQLGFDGEVLALVAEPKHRQAIRLAGATVVVAPRIMLAATLAARASHKLGPRVAGLQKLGTHLSLSEVRIDISSPLAGQTLAEAEVGEQTGTTIVGLWVGGALVTLPSPDTRLPARSTMIAVGAEQGLRQLCSLAGGANLDARGSFIVAGYGEVGRKVAELLEQAHETVTTIDREARTGVTHVGDVLDPELLDGLDLDHTQAVVLALDNDSATLFSTVLLRSRAPNIAIIARVNEMENVERIHRAGADFALSISQVTGQMLAHRLLGRDEVTIEPKLTVTKVSAGPLVGQRPSDLDLRADTGCSVVAVERDDEVIVRFDEAFRFEAQDAVFICGSTHATDRYRERLGASR